MTIGERIKKRRMELGLTQGELAERMGYTSRAAICTVEKDKEDLTTTRIRRFAEALQTTPSYLMGWENEDGSPDNASSNGKKTEKAIELYDSIMSLPPDDQNAILTLLKSLQNKP